MWNVSSFKVWHHAEVSKKRQLITEEMFNEALTIENADSTFLRNVDNRLPNDAVISQAHSWENLKT